VRRILGSALIALPIVVFLTAMVIHKGWGYVITTLAMAALGVGCIVGGMHLLASKSGRPKD
jgi:L-lactate permease